MRQLKIRTYLRLLILAKMDLLFYKNALHLEKSMQEKSLLQSY